MEISHIRFPETPHLILAERARPLAIDLLHSLRLFVIEERQRHTTW